MLFMNEWEVQQAAYQYNNHPVLGPASRALMQLVDAVNRCSDGWPYWAKAPTAAKKLMQLIKDGPDKASEVRLRQAMIPIKTFCTRYGVTKPEVK